MPALPSWLPCGLFALAVPALAGEAQSEPQPEPLPTIAVTSLQSPEPDAAEPDEPATPLEPITVVATRTARRVSEVTGAVTVIDADALQRLGASDLGEALGGLVGVEIGGGPRPGGESINLRGLGGTRVLMSVDGARQNFDGAHRSRLLVDPELLKSIEVLRGPASALWGSDALGGVVRLATKDAADLLAPGERFGMRLRTGFEGAARERRNGFGTYGRIGELDLVADLTSLDSADLEQADGQVLPWSALDSRGLLLKAGHGLESPHAFGLSLQGFAQQGRTPSNPAREVADDNPLLDRRNRQQYLSSHYDYQPLAGAGRLAAANLTVYRSSLAIVEDRIHAPRHDVLDFATDGASAQATLALPALDSQLTFGGEGYRDRAAATRDGAPRAQFPDAWRRVVGAFAQNEWQATPRWQLVPGLRYDRFRAHSVTGAAPDVDAGAWSMRLGSRWALASWLDLHASLGDAFRAPSLLESYAQGTHFLGNDFRPNPGLRPERARNTELGLRVSLDELLGDDSLSLSLNAYRNAVRDYIETVVRVETEGPAPPPAQCLTPRPAAGCINRDADGNLVPFVPPIFVGGYTTSENLPSATIRGYELEARYAWAGLQLSLGYGVVRGARRDGDAPLLNIPADALKADLGWQLGELRLGTRLVHAAAQRRVPLDETGAPIVPVAEGYTVTQLYASWQPGGALRALRLDAGVDNLTDRAYRPYLASVAEAGRNPRFSLSWQF